MDDLTPFLRQYLEIKDRHQDAILFFRMGDFFEMFFDDAKIAAKALDITLTARGRMGDEPIPMAGVPHHAAEGYIASLVDQGFKVAICEQVEDPRHARGIVKREVVNVVTPGVILEAGHLEARANNFLLALSKGRKTFGIAYLDVSTADFYVAEPTDLAALRQELSRIEPRELLLPENLRLDPEINQLVSEREVLANYLPDQHFGVDDAREALLEHFDVGSLEAFGCEKLVPALGAAGAVLHYLRQTRPGHPFRLDRMLPYQPHDFLVLDEATRRNLEVVKTLQEGKKSGSLLHLLDETVTAMGGRLLRRHLSYPLIHVDEINRRLDLVEIFFRRAALRRGVREALQGVSDLERLNAKVVARSANARDLNALASSLERVPELVGQIKAAEEPGLAGFLALDPCLEAVSAIRKALVEDPPVAVKEGGLIRAGYHPELDELTYLSREGKGFIARLEADERRKTGISSLKVRYNKVFGYFIEITKANLGAVPDHYLRKQTLTGAERFITPELKEYETKVLGAEERQVELEYELFTAVRELVADLQARVKQLALALAELDVLCGLAEVAVKYNYVRPEVDQSDAIDIEDGRHPVVERSMSRERFVPNDIKLDGRERQIIILTGPNMAGKSTIMRQVALIALMAHMGSFVPARRCRLGVLDRIFTRVGASDNLSRGQSTFMVEMTETAHILNFATPKSLVLLDEIGRGTSTFDGLSIAWAVAELLHDKLKARTIFATHYHELIDLALTRPRVKNYNVVVTEWGEKVVFLRKLKEGGASRSYGIAVARLAGLPREVIDRAKEVLSNLEKGELNELGEPRLARRKAPRENRSTGQLTLFSGVSAQLKESLLALDVNTLTPLEALSRLAELQELARKT